MIVSPLLLAALPGPDLKTVSGVALALLAAAVVGPASAVGATAAMLPLVFITAQIGGTRWSLLELALLCTAAACAGEIGLLVLRSRRAPDLARLLYPVDLTVVALAIGLIGLISLLWIADTRGAANSHRELRRVIVEPLVIILAVRLSPLDASRRLVGRCLVASGVVVSTIAIAQVGLRSSGVEIGALFRPIGTYPHPNNLALFLERIVWVPIAIAGGPAPRRLGSALTVLIAVGCAATLSRGAVIALVVGGIVWAVLSRRPFRRWAVVTGVVAAGGLVLLARVGGDGTESIGSRGTIWEGAVAMIRDYPVTGIGLDQFFQLYGTRYVEPTGWGERYTSHPHNILLDFWLQLGVGGLVVLAAIVWLSVRRASAVRLRRSPDLVQAALLAGLAAGLAHGLIDNGFFLADLAAYLWLTLALTVPSGTRPSPE